MSKLVLFSEPTEVTMQKISRYIFPQDQSVKTIGFIPAHGLNGMPEKYKIFWESQASQNGYKIEYIDFDSTDTERNKQLIRDLKIIFVSGGNTFTLLSNLRKTFLKDPLIEFLNKPDTIYVGFSAGAILATPTIKISQDNNTSELDDLTGLNILDFEIMPHFTQDEAVLLADYKKTTNNQVITLTDDQALIADSNDRSRYSII